MLTGLTLALIWAAGPAIVSVRVHPTAVELTHQREPRSVQVMGLDADGWRRDRTLQTKAIMDYIDDDRQQANAPDEESSGAAEDYGYENLRDQYKPKNNRMTRWRPLTMRCAAAYSPPSLRLRTSSVSSASNAEPSSTLRARRKRSRAARVRACRSRVGTQRWLSYVAMARRARWWVTFTFASDRPSASAASRTE